MATAKRYGLRLTLGGAPNSPHTIPGLRGYFRPNIPTPVGGKDDPLTLEEAREVEKDHSDVLELVEVTNVAAAEEQVLTDLEDGRRGLGEARRDGRAQDNPSRTKDEMDAVSPKKEGQ